MKCYQERSMNAAFQVIDNGKWGDIERWPYLLYSYSVSYEVGGGGREDRIVAGI
jgi:hypothetical protein